MRAGESIKVPPSNFGADKNVTNKFGPVDERIPFSDLVAFAIRGDKPEVWLAERTGRDPRTARRWLADQNGRPQIALAVVMGELLRRLD